MSIYDYLKEDKVLFKVILSAIAILSFLSLIISLFIIGLFILKKNARNTMFQLILILFCSEVLNAISKFLSIKRLFSDDSDLMLPNFKDPICIIQRICGIYSDICSFIMFIVISLYSKNKIMSNNKLKLKLNYIRIIAVITPLALSLA